MAEATPIIQEEIVSIIRGLRQPAGDDSKFSSLEAISANRNSFIEQVHKTWKHLHTRSIEEILKIESSLKSPEVKKLPEDFPAFLKYIELIWRRINDAIIWTMHNMEGHYVRRLCLRKPRPSLSESNAKAMVPLIEQLNSDPLTFALWSDATCCVDVGDIISRSFSGKPNGIIEVKTGRVNEDILELIHSTDSNTDYFKEIEALASVHGAEAVKQMGRVLRQMETTAQVTQVLRTDRGFDPLHKMPIEILQSNTVDKSYDEVLGECIEASSKKPVLECIEGCLWIYVDQDQNKTYREVIQEFTELVYAKNPKLREWNRDRYGRDYLAEVIPLDANLLEPFAVPIFLRHFEPEIVKQVLLGRLKDRVLLYFDWDNYKKIFEEFGARLTWSTPKQARAQSSVPHENRTVVIGNRIPIITLQNGERISGYSRIYRVFFEGILPSVIAAQYVEMLRMSSPLTT